MSATSPGITESSRLALLMHENLTEGWGKMGLGLLRYSRATITAVVDRQHAGGDVTRLTGIDRPAPIVATVEEAAGLGADTLVIGVATAGGGLPDGWLDDIRRGLRAGMSLVNPMHAPLARDLDLTDLLQPGRWIWDLRQEPAGLEPGLGRARELRCPRVLTVGTDMAIGKMTAALELDRAARARGLRSRFLASGQIGICIAGDGVPVDAVRVDFASGSVEQLVLKYGPESDVLWIEGQGSILHPASTAWLPLIRGSCPTHLILVHRAGQAAISRAPWVRIPPLREVARLYEEVCSASGALPAARVAGIALNCAGLTRAQADDAAAAAEAESGLPAADVLVHGASRLLGRVLSS